MLKEKRQFFGNFRREKFLTGFTPTPERAPSLLIWHPRLPSARLVWGFTLIELLVVISIIGMLASIVLASIKSFQQRASIAKTLTYSKSLDNLLAADAVGIWNFDDQTNPTKDTSGWANNGTVNGAAFTDDTPHKAAGAGAGKYGLSFDGGDYVSVPDGPAFDISGNGFTYSAWIKPTSLSGNYSMIMGHYLPYFDVTNAKKVHLSMMAGGSQRYLPGNTDVKIDEWSYVAATYDTVGYMRVYLNGKLDGTAGPWTPAANYDSLFYIGQYDSGGTYRFTGLIDEVRVFNRALTQAEVRKLYAEGLKEHNNFASKQQ